MSEVAVTAAPDTGGTVYAIIGQTVPADRLKEAIEHPDALRVAYNVGVLELLSLGLTLFGIVLALVAVMGFWAIRGAAIRSARAAAKEEVAEIAGKQAKQWVEEHGKATLAQYATAGAGSTVPTVAIDPATEAKVIEEASEVKA